jgi:hypothetical protein
MSFGEISALLNTIKEKEQEEWEKMRLQWFYTVASQPGSKLKRPSDLIRFSWEKKAIKEKSLTLAEIERRWRDRKR